MDNDPKSRLRKLSAELTVSLKLTNVRDVAQRMWSAGYINETEMEAIKSCTTSSEAVGKLCELTLARGDKSIIGLAQVLRDIEMPHLAEKLCPTSAPAASDTGSKSLCKNLLKHANFIAERLTTGESDKIIALLRSSEEEYLSEADYEELKETKGAINRAAALIDKVLKRKDERCAQYFANALADIRRKELSSKVLDG